MQKATLMAAAIVSACGGSGPAIPPIANAPTAQVTGSPGGQFNSGQYNFNISKDERRHRLALAGSLEDGALAVQTGLKALGIPATTLSSTPRVLGSERFVMRRSLAGKPLSAYLDCGTTPSGVLANTYRIHAAVLAAVERAGNDSVLVETRITAQAFSNDGASGGAVDCTSTGALEKRLLEETRVARQVKSAG